MKRTRKVSSPGLLALITIPPASITIPNCVLIEPEQSTRRPYISGTFSFFSKEDVPEMYGLLVDCSGSMRTQLGIVIEAGGIVINANKPGDETFLVRFISSDKIYMEHDFTTDKTVLLDRLNSFAVEGGQTALLDALY